MTTPPDVRTEVPSLQRPTVLAVCQGHRCRALLADQRLDGMDALRQAVRRSRHGILVTTGCAGPCSHAPVVVVGTTDSTSGRLEVRPEAVLGPVGPAEVQLLAGHVRRASPAPLPASLAKCRLGRS